MADQTPRPSVCLLRQIGFNGGHSALLWFILQPSLVASVTAHPASAYCAYHLVAAPSVCSARQPLLVPDVCVHRQSTSAISSTATSFGAATDHAYAQLNDLCALDPRRLAVALTSLRASPRCTLACHCAIALLRYCAFLPAHLFALCQCRLLVAVQTFSWLAALSHHGGQCGRCGA